MKELKQKAMEQVFKLMSNPKVTELMSSPKFMGAITKGFELQNQIRAGVENSLRSLAERLNLASREDVSSLNQKVSEMESSLDSIQSKVDEIAKKGATRKKKDAVETPETEQA